MQIVYTGTYDTLRAGQAVVEEITNGVARGRDHLQRESSWSAATGKSLDNTSSFDLYEYRMAIDTPPATPAPLMFSLQVNRGGIFDTIANIPIKEDIVLTVSGPDFAATQQAIDRGEKINAIKEIRGLFGTSLKFSKDIIEHIFTNSQAAMQAESDMMIRDAYKTAIVRRNSVAAHQFGKLCGITVYTIEQDLKQGTNV